MKFYRDKLNYYWDKIKNYKLTTIYHSESIWFLKDSECHNSKNACFVKNNRIKYFYLNGIYYGNQYTFTKKSWRHFIKLKAFL